MPRFREYEYTINSLHALCRVAAWQEVKIAEFYSGEAAPELPEKMKKVLRLGSLSSEDFAKEWVRILQRDPFRGCTKLERH